MQKKYKSELSKDVMEKRKKIIEFKKLFRYNWIVENIGFFLFLGFLTVIYIANGHQADKSIREISRTNKKLVELEYEYKTLKSELMYKTRESELIKAAEPMGLSLSDKQPVHIKMIERHRAYSQE